MMMFSNTEIMTQAFTLPEIVGHLNLNIEKANNFHNDTVTKEILIFLPSKSGGIGMTRHNGMKTENAIMRNITNSRHFLASYFANDMLRTYDPTYGDVVPGTAEGLENDTGLTQEDMATLTVVNIRSVLKTAKDKAYSNLAKRIAAQKSANLRTRGWAAMLISNGSGTSGALSFINSSNGQHTAGYFGRQAYRGRIWAVTIIGPFNNHTGEVIPCLCGENYNVPLHALTCNNNAPNFTRRHTALWHDYR
jgi:hypothetical protein